MGYDSLEMADLTAQGSQHHTVHISSRLGIHDWFKVLSIIILPRICVREKWLGWWWRANIRLVIYKYYFLKFYEDVLKIILPSSKYIAFDIQVSCSAEMEVFSLKSLLTFLLSSGVRIRVLVTDRSKSVRKMMEEDFPAISHEFDIWYVSHLSRDSWS